jgi:hypothetical protein
LGLAAAFGRTVGRRVGRSVWPSGSVAAGRVGLVCQARACDHAQPRSYISAWRLLPDALRQSRRPRPAGNDCHTVHDDKEAE